MSAAIPGMRLAALLLALSLTAPAAPAGAAGAATPAVQTRSGVVTGETAQGVARFLGVPYAAPPVGPLRWTPPKLPAPWTKPLAAKAYRESCAQADTLGHFAKPSRAEDCLYLNVFAPPASKGPHPVMVWIYGGGLRAGSAADYDATALARLGVVVVTFNYRMGVLGFFAGADSPSPNFGLLDQIAVLRWVQDNVARFGGNPANVTIFGESAGARSVAALLGSPAAKGLFHRAILESASYDGASMPAAAAQKAAEGFTKAAGCTPGDVACLRALSVEKILALQAPFIIAPVAGGPELPELITTAFPAGRFNRVPVIAGWNHDEARWQVANGRPPTAEDYRKALAGFAARTDPAHAAALAGKLAAAYAPSDPPSLALARLQSDYGFICPTLRMLDAVAAYGPAYAYEFDDQQAPQYNDPGDIPFGAAHTSELQFLFPGFHGATGPRHALSPAEMRLARDMRRLWTSFARDGRPAPVPGGPSWPTYDPARGRLLVLETPHPEAHEKPYDASRHCDLWAPAAP
jgi:para-nitrobenzyl esterase